MSHLDLFPINPVYGAGIWRRRIRLMPRPAEVLATLDDDHHSMWCRVRHDGLRVTGIEAGTTRIPTTACPGAALAIRELEGMALATPQPEIFGGGRPRRNCTHMFDLAALAIAHAGRGGAERRYDVAIPDEVEAPIRTEVRRDGAPIHQWLIRSESIVEPAPFAGQPIVRGFTPFALRTFEGDALEAALVLHKSYFVARSRSRLVDIQPGLPISDHDHMREVCHSYSAGQVGAARRLGHYVLDFTDGVTECNRPS